MLYIHDGIVRKLLHAVPHQETKERPPMPITPLHFGTLAPINHFAKGKVSNVSFILVNLLLDFKSILFVLTGEGAISHGVEHSFMGAIFYATLVAMFGVRSWVWVIGAYLGGITHIFLDMLVHPEMVPLDPWVDGNPFYMGWMEPLSMALLPLTVWLIFQYVSGGLGWMKKRQGVVTKLTPEPVASKSE